MLSSKNKWCKTPGSSWSTKRIRSKFKAREATCHFQTRKFERAQMGQGRAGSRRRKPDPINQAIHQPLDVTQGIQRGTRIVTGKTNSAQGTNSAHDRLINNNNPFMPDVLLHPDPLLKIPEQQNTLEISHNPNINLDFEENLLFQEGIMSETYQRLDKSFFQNPRRLRRPHKQGESDS